MAIVVVARLAIVLYVSCEVGCHKLFDVAAAAAYHFDPLGFQNILRSLAHISCQHHCHSHLAKDRSYSALASATFRRSHLAHSCNLTVDYIKNRIIRAMAEMIIHASVSCWYCYLHNLIQIKFRKLNLFSCKINHFYRLRNPKNTD